MALLREKGVEPEIVEYLHDPPDVATLTALVKKLGIEPAQLVRRKEYQELGLPETADDAELLALMTANPKIIERPIVVVGQQARLGRPPEKVLEIL